MVRRPLWIWVRRSSNRLKKIERNLFFLDHYEAETLPPCQTAHSDFVPRDFKDVFDPKSPTLRTAANTASLDLCVQDLMFSFANNSCEEHSLKAESTSLKSKVSCGGKMQLLHTTASFETVAYWAVQSFTLGRAVSITTDWFGKSLGRHHKKEKLKEGGREG